MLGNEHQCLQAYNRTKRSASGPDTLVVLVIQQQSVLSSEPRRRRRRRSGAEVIQRQCSTDAAVDGQDALLVALAPVLDDGDVDTTTGGAADRDWP